MPTPLTSTETQQANLISQESPWIWLFEVEVPTNPITRYRFCAYRKQIEFGFDSSGNALTYYPAPVSHLGVELDANGDLPEFTLIVQDAEREVAQVVEQYDGLEGQPIEMIRIHINDLANPQAGERFAAVIQSANVQNERIAFLVSSFNIANYQVPSERYTEGFCRYVSAYGGARCGVSAADFAANPTCGGTLADCKIRNNSQRFGNAIKIG